MRRVVTVIYDDDDYNPKGAAVCEVAETTKDRLEGLSNRDSVPYGTGMIFIPAGSFWMKNTLVDLDLLYVSGDRIIDIIEMTVPKDYGTLKTYSLSDGSADYAIEYPSGWVKIKGITVGDIVATVSR